VAILSAVGLDPAGIPEVDLTGPAGNGHDEVKVPRSIDLAEEAATDGEEIVLRRRPPRLRA
jgi:hypothetical protein